jgi:hypothetical protein
MTAAEALKRQPLAFGAQQWGPLPGSAGVLLWGGPGERMFFYVAGVMRLIEHPSASAVYQTVKQADEAARAFVAAYEAEGETP